MKKYNVLYEYISENFSLESIGPRLVSNILEYAIKNFENEEQMNDLLYQLLSGLGLEPGELEEINYDC